MIGRALLASVALTLALAPSFARASECPPSTVDVSDWPIVRSAKVPGFTLRLPRNFTRDTTAVAHDSTPSAHWRDAARGRFAVSHLTSSATPASSPTSGSRTISMRCETRVGTATATIVAVDEGASTYVVHARVLWPDGEALDVRADAIDRLQLEILLAAVRTVRRAGA